MPLFGHKNAAPVEPTPTARGHPRRRSSSLSSSNLEGARKSGFFGRKRSTSSERLRHSNTTRHPTGKLSHNSTRASGGGLFNRHSEDPSIAHARERVMSAENAEREADRALVQARAAVKEAREHIKILEKEAAEEARLAKIKQHHARDISKRAKPLGREYLPGSS
ncbi:uncharacterized protein A1O9_03833 [Exophiala aquamarina CBS 119918]|uniref:Uncharacterized protein n=1 Tax=Exophiala aquamarina CBS 119918 TaxID=1182545 RepID=A0A072PTW6_9EURO|nr:uncharacterized protein A1O9_03833 [Exophiala aquamarina CBS 119918]KEF58990.1 hypothetical protein A1O9_03833 [Exophiala aquamarina CBS 119918]